MKKFGAKARLKGKVVVQHKDVDILLDGRTSLVYLHKTSKGDYVFCVRKLIGTGRSGVILNRKDFKWV